ncbi:NAD(P)/FAD-dependent oxidoreductase [Marihabitans asiaticum]|uniref:Putative flavoprotein involved in K+ transport n=1 Tax=Marihabitans asiaticum TaxID=415218 RepID=A0A560WGJ5_9MICO|nr:NAD(P)/FAD-dependent oxidoreductase [Marihabitans asiaticum]TWD16718.1 putative flavoprotein involved in K+ transport [Marihabitans asiaticum]
MPNGTVAEEVAARWLESFAEALGGADPDALRRLFLEDAEWRDIVALTWDFTTLRGAGEIAQSLVALAPQARLSDLRLASGRTPPAEVGRAGETVTEAIWEFTTAVGRGAGVIRLLAQPDGSYRARLVSSTLQELTGHEERRGAQRPQGTAYSRTFGGQNWLDQRLEEQKYNDRQPEVVVVGGGQAGLAAAARLRVLGVDALIVEKLPRIGDVWRQRYHSLTLHNEVWVASFPYLEFPDTWPTFLPKDKLAGWMEYYAEAMELNVWTNTAVTGGYRDDDAWHLTVSRDGEDVVLQPKHVVFATGSVSGRPYMPEMPGLDEFRGEVLHSSRYTSGSRYENCRALVLGTGTSGHDVAQDLHALGADVTIVQRSSTTVVSLQPSGVLVYGLYSQGLPIEDVDLISSSNTMDTLVRANKIMAQQMVEYDAELLDRLAAVGFRTDIGEDGTGFHLKYNRRGGGYYINVGASDLIADGQIGLLQHDQISRFTKDGVQLVDGSYRPLDVVVFATGYRNQQEDIRDLFGDDVADRLGPIWGIGEDGEMNNMWRPTAQPGLWFNSGSLAASRINSKFLALQIKADLEGINPRTATEQAALVGEG